MTQTQLSTPQWEKTYYSKEHEALWKRFMTGGKDDASDAASPENEAAFKRLFELNFLHYCNLQHRMWAAHYADLEKKLLTAHTAKGDDAARLETVRFQLSLTQAYKRIYANPAQARKLERREVINFEGIRDEQRLLSERWDDFKSGGREYSYDELIALGEELSDLKSDALLEAIEYAEKA